METLQTTATAEEQPEQASESQAILARRGLELAIRAGHAQQTDGREFQGEYWQSEPEQATGAYQ